MRLLLDTHALLWFVLADSQLSKTVHGLIADKSNERLISPACFWEVAIKGSTGKYSLTMPHEQFFISAINTIGLKILPIEPKHTAVVATLPFHHRDPFDRLLIAQALSEGVPIVSADKAIDVYGVARHW